MTETDTPAEACALIVDDSEDSLLLMRASLERAGFRVVEAHDGRHALERFADARPDIVLMDVLMPELDGFGACRAIRARDDGRDTPVLLITSLEDIESIELAYQAGATDFVTKPVNSRILGQRARYLLRGVRAIREANQQRAALVARNEELERLRAKLEATNRDLEGLNEMKSEFVSLVSHELRTPLTSIKSFTEIMLDEPNGSDVDTRLKYLAIINEETDRLERLISDVLDLQKIDAGKMVWRDARVDVAAVMHATLESARDAFAAKGLELVFEGAPSGLEAFVDADKLRQIIHNLLSNALKFTISGGVTVSVCAPVDAERPGGSGLVRVTVRDSGSGLSCEQLEKVFDAFYQADSSQRREQRGSGLGLSICRHIIARYGGRIWAESEPGRGCTISFELPRLAGESAHITDALMDMGMVSSEDLSHALYGRSSSDASADSPAPEAGVRPDEPVAARATVADGEQP